MKIYIAARAKTRIDEVKQIQKQLREMGHSITYDWATEDVGIRRPYRDPDNRRHNETSIPKMLDAARHADVFILLDEPGLRGAYVEYGVFLAEALKNPKQKRTYIVGPDSHEREFIFESPEYVRFADSIQEVYRDLN